MPAVGGPLYHLATALAAALTPGEVAGAIAEHAAPHIGATHSVLWLPAGMDGELAPVGRRDLVQDNARDL